MVKNLPTNIGVKSQEMQFRSLGQEDPLEEAMATHSGILAWRIPWMEGAGRLQSMGDAALDTAECAHTHRTMI